MKRRIALSGTGRLAQQTEPACTQQKNVSQPQTEMYKRKQYEDGQIPLGSRCLLLASEHMFLLFLKWHLLCEAFPDSPRH